MIFHDYFDSHRLEDLDRAGDFGIYVHVPFCMRRCRYCAFVSSVIRPVPSREYVDILCREYETRRPEMDASRLTTLYLGGGTPTMLCDDDIGHLVQFVVSRDGQPLEMTLEANPEHVTQERAHRWRSFGFTRVSLGIQSFRDSMLSMLGRRHTGIQAVQAVECLRGAGFDEISVDLIYGARQDSSGADEARLWQAELETVRDLPVSHLSCYELTLEENTPLWASRRRGREVLCEEDDLLEMMRMIPEVTGMAQYEISNYSRDGAMSRHNLSCWAGVPYLGIGAGAHSMIRCGDRVIRRAGGRDVRGWVASSRSGGAIPAPQFCEELDMKTHLAERLMCAARTRLWWSPHEIAWRLNTSLDPFVACLNRALGMKMLEGRADGCMRTTQRGMELNNRLDEILFEY